MSDYNDKALRGKFEKGLSLLMKTGEELASHIRDMVHTSVVIYWNTGDLKPVNTLVSASSRVGYGRVVQAALKPVIPHSVGAKAQFVGKADGARKRALSRDIDGAPAWALKVEDALDAAFTAAEAQRAKAKKKAKAKDPLAGLKAVIKAAKEAKLSEEECLENIAAVVKEVYKAS